MTNNIHKKFILAIKSAVICTFVLIFLVTSAYADIKIDPFGHVYRHENQIDVSLLNDNIIMYEEIPDLIFNYNPTIRNLWNNFEVNKESDEIADDYYEAADAYEGMGGDDVTSAQYEAKAKGYRMQGDNNVVDSSINYLSNIKTEKTLIYNTRLQMINYHKSILEKEKAEKSLEETKRSVESAEVNYENGNLTKSELLKAKSQLKTAEANLLISDSNIKNYKRNVLINCGYSMNDNVEVMEVPHITSDFASINYKNDLEKAIASNIQYEIYKRSLNNSRSEEMKNTYKINVDNAKRLIESDLEVKSRNLKNAITNNYTAGLKIDDAKSEYEKATNEYSEGNISKKQFETAKYNYEVSLLDANLSKYDIDIAYLDYIEAIEGLAEAGA